MPQKLKLHIDFTKSLKRDNIYKLCLWMLEEQKKLKPLLYCAELLKHNDIGIFGTQMEDEHNC